MTNDPFACFMLFVLVTGGLVIVVANRLHKTAYVERRVGEFDYAGGRLVPSRRHDDARPATPPSAPPRAALR